MNSKQLEDIAVISDLEPDDIAAFIAIIKAGIKIGLVIVINPDKDDMWDRKQKYNQMCQVLPSMQSVDVIFTNVTNDSCTSVLSGYVKKMLNNDITPSIVCLATFLPLIRLSQENQDLAKITTVFAYGAKNYRWGRDEYIKASSHSQQKVIDIFNKSFNSFYMFETFKAFGEYGTADQKSAPIFSNWIQKCQQPEIVFLKTQIELWNTHIMEKCIKGLKKNRPSLDKLDKSNIQPLHFDELTRIMNDMEDKKRIDAKIVLYIHNDCTQMVFADVGLIMGIMYAPEQFKRVHLKDTGFIQTSSPEECDTAYYFESPISNDTNHLLMDAFTTSFVNLCSNAN